MSACFSKIFFVFASIKVGVGWGAISWWTIYVSRTLIDVARDLGGN